MTVKELIDILEGVPESANIIFLNSNDAPCHKSFNPFYNTYDPISGSITIDIAD